VSDRYRNLTPEEEARLRALPDAEPWDDAFVDTITGKVHFARFEDDATAALGYRSVRWERSLDGGPR
jgi:hypothetical protein